MIPFILVSIFFAFGNSKNSAFSTSTWFFSSGKYYYNNIDDFIGVIMFLKGILIFFSGFF